MISTNCSSAGWDAISSWIFFFNDTATTEIYTLSLHDALPIRSSRLAREGRERRSDEHAPMRRGAGAAGARVHQPLGRVHRRLARARADPVRVAGRGPAVPEPDLDEAGAREGRG